MNIYFTDCHFTSGNKKLAMSLKQILKRFKMSELLYVFVNLPQTLLFFSFFVHSAEVVTTRGASFGCSHFWVINHGQLWYNWPISWETSKQQLTGANEFQPPEAQMKYSQQCVKISIGKVGRTKACGTNLPVQICNMAGWKLCNNINQQL